MKGIILVFCILLFCSNTFAVLPKVEADVISDFVSAFTFGGPGEWYSHLEEAATNNDYSKACEWPEIARTDPNQDPTNMKISCNPQQTSVTKIEFDSFWLSYIPPSIVNLSNLKTLKIRFCHVRGPIPSGLFSLPDLSIINLSDNNLNGTLPDVMTSPIQTLTLEGNWIQGTIPMAIAQLPNLKKLHLDRNRFECPFADVIEALEAKETLQWCSLTTNLFADPYSASLCNGWFGTTTKCSLLPAIGTMQDVSSPADFQFGDSTIWCEVRDRTIFFFAMKSNGQPFRDEYVSMEFYGYQEVPNPSEINPNRTILQEGQFHAFSGFIQPDPNEQTFVFTGKVTVRGQEVEVNTTISIDHPLSPNGAKFSLDIGTFPFIDIENSYFKLPVQFSMHGPHSIKDRVVCNAINSTGAFQYTRFCKSDILELTLDVVINETNRAFIFNSKSPKLNYFFEFPVEYYWDGNGGILTESFQAAVSVPIELNMTNVLENNVGPLDQQTILYCFSLTTSTWTDLLEYDPSVTMNYLFSGDIPTAEPTSGPVSPTDQSQVTPPGNSVAVGVGVTFSVVGAIAVGVAVASYLSPSFRKKVFPFAERDNARMSTAS